MVSLFSLWMPILLSAVVCWIAGSLIWVVMPHHKKDFAPLDQEEQARNALRGLKPGLYNIPHVADPSKVTDEDRQRFAAGPVGFLTIMPDGLPNMGKNLVQQMIYYIVVGVIVAYVASVTLPSGADYLKVFQVVGTTAWLGFGFGAMQDSIWFGKPWSYNFKILIDALIYALLSAGIFGWLWP
ncbi:MAG: hypothetical protein KJO35_08245 [Gammaproteobacteria bacterium]|nr:hypothetical protein [Gammaproteobacteria bacterium]NNF66423.1 hypothetical protein [Gammaproteobacteria bacterium]